VNPVSLAFLFPASERQESQVLALVRDELPRVERLLGRILGPRQDLADLVQAVFVEALRSSRSYRAQGSPGAFISGITVRVARRALRGTAFSRHRAELSFEPASNSQDPEAHSASAERMRHLRAAVARLSPKKQVAFLLWALEGMSTAEISAHTGSSESAVRSQIFHAQKELRAMAERSAVLRELFGERQ